MSPADRFGIDKGRLFATMAASGTVFEHRGAMRSREEGVDLVSYSVEGQSVGAGFGWHHFQRAHRARIDDIDYAGIADGDIKALGLWMQKNHIGCTTKAHLTDYPP